MIDTSSKHSLLNLNSLGVKSAPSSADNALCFGVSALLDSPKLHLCPTCHTVLARGEAFAGGRILRLRPSSCYQNPSSRASYGFQNGGKRWTTLNTRLQLSVSGLEALARPLRLCSY